MCEGSPSIKHGMDTPIGDQKRGNSVSSGSTDSVSINGANRLGSNSLTECLVFGARAGKASAEFARAQTAYYAPQIIESSIRRKKNEKS